jgi:hypothetical protein
MATFPGGDTCIRGRGVLRTPFPRQRCVHSRRQLPRRQHPPHSGVRTLLRSVTRPGVWHLPDGPVSGRHRAVSDEYMPPPPPMRLPLVAPGTCQMPGEDVRPSADLPARRHIGEWCQSGLPARNSWSGRRPLRRPSSSPPHLPGCTWKARSRGSPAAPG